MPLAEAPPRALNRLGRLRAAAPKFIGRRTFKSYDLAEIAKYVDWGPFFQLDRSLFGPFPAILDDKVVGEQARKVYADGLAMMKRIVEGRWLTANGVVGFYPANSVNDGTSRSTRTRRAAKCCSRTATCASAKRGA